MPPRVRGRGKGPMRGGPSGLIPSQPHHSNPYEDSGDSWPLAQRSPTHTQSSYHLYHSHQSHHSHHSRHSYHDEFNPNHYFNTPPADQNQLDQPNPMDEDSDPEMTQSGSHAHPIKISSDSNSYAGSPYQGPNEWDQYWNQFTFANTPSHHPQHLLYKKMFIWNRWNNLNHHLSRQGGNVEHVCRYVWVNGRVHCHLCPKTFPTIHEDPQMGGPSNASPVVEPTPLPVVQPPSSGFNNPIPTYPDISGYDPFNPSTPVNYQALSHDPYMRAVMHNALYPSRFPHAYPPTGYPNYGYQYPVIPQPQTQPPPPLEAINEALEGMKEMQQQAEITEYKTNNFFKKLSKLVKGKNDE